MDVQCLRLLHHLRLQTQVLQVRGSAGATPARAAWCGGVLSRFVHEYPATNLGVFYLDGRAYHFRGETVAIYRPFPS